MGLLGDFGKQFVESGGMGMSPIGSFMSFLMNRQKQGEGGEGEQAPMQGQMPMGNPMRMMGGGLLGQMMPFGRMGNRRRFGMMGGYPSMWRSMGQQQPMDSPYSGMGQGETRPVFGK